MEVTFKKARCPQCGDEAPMVLGRTKLGTPVVKTTCSKGHVTTWETDEVFDLLENPGALLDEAENQLENVLVLHGLPKCLGQMNPRYDYEMSDYALLSDGDGDTLEDLARNNIEKQVEHAKEHAVQLKHCVACRIFDRCKVLSVHVREG